MQFRVFPMVCTLIAFFLCLFFYVYPVDFFRADAHQFSLALLEVVINGAVVLPRFLAIICDRYQPGLESVSRIFLRTMTALT
jgi:hypothetical protein